MKQLTRLESIELYRIGKETLPDGDVQETETQIGTYKVVIQELNDNVSATIYGADINKILRISSVNKILEILLKEKLNNTFDNISKYKISYGNNKYKVKDIKTRYIDIKK